MFNYAHHGGKNPPFRPISWTMNDSFCASKS